VVAFSVLLLGVLVGLLAAWLVLPCSASSFAAASSCSLSGQGLVACCQFLCVPCVRLGSRVFFARSWFALFVLVALSR
jgi:hypothetical protein